MANTTAKKGKRILNCISSKNVDKDWSIDTALKASITKAAALPKSVDLRAAWWGVSDQGSTGSCVGWATADGLLRWHFVNSKKIKTTEKMSVRFVWMASKELDEFSSNPSTFIEDSGTSLKAALDIVRKYGSVKETILPFGSGKLFPGTEDEFFAEASKLKITNYFNLLKGATDKIAALKRWLAFNGPILTCLDVDQTWYDAKKNKGNLDKYTAKTTYGGHAICIVGYTEDRFIIRNSWGTTLWGDKGFGYASYSYIRDAINEAYGISVF